MESKSEVNVGKFVGRHLSQIKLMTRLLDHELESAKGAREVTERAQGAPRLPE